ncbi:DNA repair protein XRCC2 homolog isoform X2 [Punica granatum]|uniref:DNA repair protein XRCC2 homolog isoform X2 n=1 Tax=Punica granatum TaxID=22663 RepID=A0A6P8DWE1_PUNGR|nr:DNA repair protein XRCC2 homolog isoform X2 [Punica granatum]
MEEKGVKGWIDGDESAREMLGRVLSERPVIVLPPPLHRIPVRAGNVVEISGPSPSAKTLLLIQAAVRCILPREWKGVHYGGLGQLVLYIDLDCRFEPARLLQVLRCRILEANGRQIDGGRDNVNGCDEELLSVCMRRFLYIRCYHSFEFLATLKTLHHRLEKERPSHGERVQLLLIDNIGAFHWVDRASMASPLELRNRKSPSLQSVWEVVVQDLRKLLLVHPMLVIASKATILGNTVNEGERHFRGRFSVDMSTDTRSGKKEFQIQKFREYMPSVWQAIVTHRIVVQTSEEHPATASHRQDQPVLHLLEWLLPALSIMDKFIVKDAGGRQMTGSN